MSHLRNDSAGVRLKHRTITSTFLSGLLFLFVAGCVAVPLEEANSLTSYADLTSANSRFKSRKAKYKAVPEDLKLVKTVYIEPTKVSIAAAAGVKKSSDRALVANAISRALCVGLSDRYQVVDRPEDADMVLHATVTRIVPTNETAAGVSVAASIGTQFLQLPFPIPTRIPLGLGGLAVEAEATSSRDGKQLAAMVWAKGANSLSSSPRISQIGDAYSLAANFSDDFSKMLVTGKTPFKGFALPKLPSGQKIRFTLGGKPRYPACERFGRSRALMDMAASQVGLPPSWTDKSLPEQVLTPPSAQIK